MKRFVLLDTAPIPNNGGALCLFEYGEDFVIKIQGGDGGQLMNTRMHGSEDALAQIPASASPVARHRAAWSAVWAWALPWPRHCNTSARTARWWWPNWCRG